jgi:hypothetical protein
MEIIIGFIIGCVIVYYYLNNRNNMNEQYNNLLIQPDEIVLKYPDIMDFIYSLEEYYDYNMDSFKDLILEINTFFLLYSKIYEDCSLIYDNLLGSKLKLINILSTYIYSVPDEKPLISKIKQFENMLDNYLKKIDCNIDSFKRNKPHPKNMFDYQ